MITSGSAIAARAIVVCCGTTGHRPLAVDLCVDGLRAAGYEPHVLLPDTADLRRLGAIDPAAIHPYSRSSGLLRGGLDERRAVRRLSEEIDSKLAVYSTGDDALIRQAVLGRDSRSRSLFLMLISGGNELAGWSARVRRQGLVALMSWGLRRTRALGLAIDPRILSARGRERRRIRYFPDPLYERSPDDWLRPCLHRSGPPTVLIFGSLSRRKGVEIAIEACRNLSVRGGSIRLVILGEIVESSLREVIQCGVREGFVEFVEGSYEDEQLIVALAEADLSFLFYVNHYGSSGALVTSVAAQCPVLVSRGGLMAREVEQFDLGVVADTQDPKVLSHIIEECLRQTPRLKSGMKRSLYLRGRARAEAVQLLSDSVCDC